MFFILVNSLEINAHKSRAGGAVFDLEICIRLSRREADSSAAALSNRGAKNRVTRLTFKSVEMKQN